MIRGEWMGIYCCRVCGYKNSNKDYQFYQGETSMIERIYPEFVDEFYPAVVTQPGKFHNNLPEFCSTVCFDSFLENYGVVCDIRFLFI
jgi:hypothetical protein